MKNGKTNQKIYNKRHSLAHILAIAVKEIYPDVKLGIGPVIENGFYYDFDLPKGASISETDLPKIENKMKQIIKKNFAFKEIKLERKEAEKMLKNQPYKLEILKEIPDKKVSFYQTGNFLDLCKGGHIANTKEIDINSFKLWKVAGAYWRGDEKNKMMTRIYGLAFNTKKELEEYLNKLKEAEKRDHTKLAQKMDLYHIDSLCGPGLPLWHPKGATIRRIIEQYISESNIKNGYLPVYTPHIALTELWKKSGHWNFYKENMFPVMELEGKNYIAKPMSCPLHILIYKSKIRSYRDLPLRFFENATVYRYEKSGVLHGLTRVRMITQDDAHIFLNSDLIAKEIENILKQIKSILKDFGIKEYFATLSTKPEKYIGSDENWKKAENALERSLKKMKIKYETAKGEGAFYGPKIDIHIKDSLGRLWQCSTIQLDFNLPERLDVEYISKTGAKEKTIMIHRALVGSIERFIGVLLEYYGGYLPFWLSPEQIWVIPVSKKNVRYAKKIFSILKEEGFRVALKRENETIGKKIRESQIQKIPYVIVIGEKEEKNKKIRVRNSQKGDLGEMSLNKFIAHIHNLHKKRK